ncbi:L-ornithine N5-oxygenase [Cladophialophora psammophila CBS 110553]|uniref:L-ornithine N(5)-monooxygenase n=1 Tax=Cladophialophora psammophila CBS 110553 TaxID=1182543 RepID=W9XUR0_9EURO|nr:L-ornithine N5-oxygenase [Cladophialophora psammophila CBS 110553]EXJ73994.1 L-ornithine N5-oxygenase [Cladophialophora psammophila CBS 110553]
MAPGVLSGVNGHAHESDQASPANDIIGWTSGPSTYGLRTKGAAAGFYSAAPGEVHDLVCVGFGPASLAIAVALHDSLRAQREAGTETANPTVRFLERQNAFKWHAGMLLPGAKMQISFIKDLATLRDPTSHFTFLNYLKQHDRLVQFSNLNTFLPSRLEFDDYLQWAARHFEHVVEYGQEVESIHPQRLAGTEEYDCFEVVSRSLATGRTTSFLSRNVVIAVGGRPAKPALFPTYHDRILHSSEYNTRIGRVLPDSDQNSNIVVMGGGQSGAEVFNDLHHRYPNATTKLIIRDSALRPSDDSPFVNEIFDPEAVDPFFDQPEDRRSESVKKNKATNYSVVRLELLEKLYDDLYMQGIKQPDKRLWQHQILPLRELSAVVDNGPHEHVDLILTNLNPSSKGSEEKLAADVVVLATGYRRDAHVDMLTACQSINSNADGHWQPRRDYSLELNRGSVKEGVGIWLQGCNEATHGLSDTLLSILATRSGELVDSIFGINSNPSGQ